MAVAIAEASSEIRMELVEVIISLKVLVMMMTG